MPDFLVTDAWAQGAPPAGGGASGLIMFVILILIFYFLLIRPQMKQAKEHKKLVESLAKGDEVVTTGGLLGRVNQVGDNFVVLEIAKDIEVKVQKHSVSAVMPKGTVKTL
ncbi:MAG: preprotein translocase subunit YajC [Gammaproteobacteria bacterium]|nr:preprotein translocase subunit YajC [Gammaproteobacteria bacterium]